MADRKACSVFHGREDRSFQLKLSFSVTDGLAGNDYVEEPVSLLTPSFKCVARYWPHWEHRKDDRGWIKISVTTTSTAATALAQALILSGHIDLPARNGQLLSPGMNDVARSLSGGGVTLVARRDEVEADCVVDGHFTAVCTVAVSFFSKNSTLASNYRSNPRLPLQTASKLDHDIFMASDLADVSFEVEGEAFKAHRLVLAARSPVFKAQLFGQIKIESCTATSIKIEDMTARTFGHMLHYMYHGVLPAAILDTGGASSSGRMLEVERLCVAADRYGLATLKQMCEEILCTSLSVSTVLSNWEFAEARSCRKLKSSCLEFLADGVIFQEVAITDKYVDLMKNNPAFGFQVRNRFKRARLA